MSRCDRCGSETSFQGYFKGGNLCKRCYDEALLSLNDEDKRTGKGND